MRGLRRGTPWSKAGEAEQRAGVSALSLGSPERPARLLSQRGGNAEGTARSSPEPPASRLPPAGRRTGACSRSRCRRALGATLPRTFPLFGGSGPRTPLAWREHTPTCASRASQTPPDLVGGGPASPLRGRAPVTWGASQLEDCALRRRTVRRWFTTPEQRGDPWGAFKTHWIPGPTQAN